MFVPVSVAGLTWRAGDQVCPRSVDEAIHIAFADCDHEA
jgi:hypothetical protein